MKDTYPKFNKIIGPVLGIGLIAFIILIIISMIALFCGPIMKFFGFQYDSAGQIILYFIIVAIIEIPSELLAKSIPESLLSQRRITLLSAKLMFILLDTLSSIIAMTLVDYFMGSVSASMISIIFISLLLTLPCIHDIGKR